MNLKKILALVLVLTMVLSFIPTYAFAEDDGIELVEEEEVQDIVEVQEEPEEEPAAEPVKEETPAEPVEEEVPEEEPAPTEGEPAEEPEEEEEEVESVTSTVADTETLEAVRIDAKIGEEPFSSLQDAIVSAENVEGAVITIVSNDASIDFPDTWENATIDLNGHSLTGDTTFQGTSADAPLAVTIYNSATTGGTISGNITVGAYATLTLTGVTFDTASTLTLNGTDAVATLANVTMNNIDTDITVKAGSLDISGGTFKGNVKADGKAAVASVKDGNFYKIDKRLIAPGYTTADYNTYENETWCTGTVTEVDANTYKAQLLFATDTGLKGKYYTSAAAAFTATLTATSGWTGATVYLTADYTEDAVELKDTQELKVYDDANGYGDNLKTNNKVKAKTTGYSIYSNTANGVITYSVNTGYKARIGTTGYSTFTAAFEARTSDNDVIVLLAAPSDQTKSLTLAKNKYVKVDLGSTGVKIATITGLFKDLPTGYSYNVTMDENNVYTITHVSNNFEVAYGESTPQYFSDLNLAIASVPTKTYATVTVMETTDITSPVKIAEGQWIDLNLGGKRVTLQSAINVAEDAVFIISSNNNESFLMDTSSATITIADGALVVIYAPVVAQDIAKLATISGAGKLSLYANVDLNRAVDGITAEAASEITIGDEATDKFTATLTGTGTAFKGGIYTINGAVDIDNAGVGFENVTKAEVNNKVEIEATVIGVKNSNLTINNNQSGEVTLDPGNGFDLLATNTIITIGKGTELATTTGLTARIEKGNNPSVKYYYSKFATAASKVEYTDNADANTVYLIKAPDTSDVFEFTKANGKLDVKADAGVEIANYSDLVEAFKDNDKPTKAIVDDVNADVHTLSQAEFSVSLIEKDSGKVVKNFTNFTEALKSAYADTQYYLIVDGADAAIAGVSIPATMPKIYLKAGVGVKAEKLQGAVAPEHTQFKKGTNIAAPYLDNDGYYVYEQEIDNVLVTWNANGGSWVSGASSITTTSTNVKYGASVTETDLPDDPVLDAQFFKGWYAKANASPSDLIELPYEVTASTTFYAGWGPAVATLTDLGGYPHNFATVADAYRYLNAAEHADWFDDSSYITLCNDAGVVYLDDFVPTGESLKLKKGTFTADVKLRNQIDPEETSTTPYESNKYTFVTTSTDSAGVTTYTVGQYTAQLETVVSESTIGNNGTWSDFQVTSTSYKIIQDFSKVNLAKCVTEKDAETSQKKTRTVKTIIFLADNPATSTDLNDDLFTEIGTSLRVKPNGHADKFKIPANEFITKTPESESGVDVYTRTTFTVTLDGNGGTPATQAVPVRAEEFVTTWNNVTKHGYTWTAWATSTDTAAAVIDPVVWSITENQTWYAKWDPVDVTYTFVATATELPTPFTSEETFSGKFGTEVGTGTNLDKINRVKNEMADKGFTVTGWTLNGETVEQPTTFTYTGTNTNLTYVATLEPITFQVTLNGNGGTPVTQTQTVKKAVGHVSTDSNLYTEPVRENYNLQGWVVGTPTSTNVYATVTEIPIATKTDLYAKWQGKPVNFTFTTTPTSIADPVKFVNKEYGTEVSTTTDLGAINKMIKAIEDNGYQFNGWTLNGVAVATPTKFESAVGTDTNIYVANVKEKEYTLTFKGNGGLINGKEEFTVTGKASDEIDVSLIKGDAKFVEAIKGNYEQSGWTLDTNSDVATTTDIKGKTFFEVKDATYYATYTAGTVTLTFNDPASTWTNVMKVTTGATDTDIKVQNNEGGRYKEPSREGYSFNGWNPKLATAEVDATYSATWLKVMDVAIVAGDYTIETLTGIVEGQKINADATITNVKIGGKPVRWLINGTDGRFFTFGETAVPVDLTSLVATATEPEAGKITVTWTNNNGTEVLATETKDAPYTPSWTGAEPTFADPVAGKLYKFMGWQVGTGTDVYNNTADTINNVKAFSTLGLKEDTTIKAYFKESPHDEVYQRSLSLTDSIAIKWRIAQVATGADASKYSAVVTFKGESTTYTSGLTSGITIARCAAKEMTELATVTVFYDGAEIATLNYSVNDYCDEMIAKEQGSTQNWTKLMQATQDYGYAAQKNYNYNTGKLPTGGGTALGNAVVAVPTTSSAVKSANTTIGISAVQFRLITEAETILSVAFKKDSGSTKTAADYVFTVNGTTVPTENIVEANGLLEVRVGGIAAKNLGDTVKVYCASKDEPNKRAVFEGSPVDYMATATSSTKTSQELKNMVKGMYNYHLEAKNALIAQ